MCRLVVSQHWWVVSELVRPLAVASAMSELKDVWHDLTARVIVTPDASSYMKIVRDQGVLAEELTGLKRFAAPRCPKVGCVSVPAQVPKRKMTVRVRCRQSWV